MTLDRARSRLRTLAAAVALVTGACQAPHSTPAPGGKPIAESPPPFVTPPAKALLERLETLRRADRQEEGLAIARGYLAQHPGTPRLHYAMGVLYGSKDDHHAAIAEFERELAADPGHFESHFGMAAAGLRLGNAAAAIPHLETCLEMRPTHLGARFQLGRALSSLGRLSDAEPHLVAVAAARDDAEGWSELGLLQRRKGDSASAIESFRRALDRSPHFPPALVNLGQLLVQSGDTAAGAALLERHRERSRLEDRLDHLHRSSRLAGATAANFAALADLQVQLGKGEEALESYRRAVALDPDFAPAALGLAALHLDRGELEEATRWAVTGLLAAPEDLRAHFLLGMIRITKGQIEEAERAFEASRQRGEWGAEAYLRVAEALVKNGDRERARWYLDRVGSSPAHSQRVGELRARLDASRSSGASER